MAAVASLSITWHAKMDQRTCPVCRALNGYTWVFDAGKDELGGELVHPQFGVVWSLAQGSRAHGHERYNCRCHITHEFNLSDVTAKVEKLAETVKASITEGEEF